MKKDRIVTLEGYPFIGYSLNSNLLVGRSMGESENYFNGRIYEVFWSNEALPFTPSQWYENFVSLTPKSNKREPRFWLKGNFSYDFALPDSDSVLAHASIDMPIYEKSNDLLTFSKNSIDVEAIDYSDWSEDVSGQVFDNVKDKKLKDAKIDFYSKTLTVSSDQNDYNFYDPSEFLFKFNQKIPDYYWLDGGWKFAMESISIV